MHKGSTAILVFSLLIAAAPSYLTPAHGAVTWPTAGTLAAGSAGADILPTALQASDGTIWLAWQSNAFNPTSSRSEIFYERFSGGVWSSSANITTPFDSANNGQPSIAQLTNSSILIFWAGNATGIYQVFYKSYFGGVWSARTQVTSGSSSNCYPSATVARNGTLWLFYIKGTPCYSGNTNVFYKTLKNGVWSSETQVTFDTALNTEERATVANDGRVWLVFAQFQNANKNDQVFDKIYNGTSWTSETQLISSNLWDDHPSMLQDRNGTLWIFWTRELPIGTDFEDKVFSEFSINNGASWSSVTQLTFDPACCSVDDWGPFAIQGSDHAIWLFYASSFPSAGNFDIYYLQSSPIFPVHHVTVSQITVSPSCPYVNLAPSSPVCLYPGGMKYAGESPLVQINVTVKDPGDFVETVTVQLTAVNATSYLAGSATGTVSAGQSTTLSITWNTTRSEKAGRYGLMAVVSNMAGETLGNLGDNSLLTRNLVHLIPLGDVDQDGSVTFIDASTVAFAFQSTPSSPHWNAYSDFDNDGYINFLDVSTMAINFGVRT